MKAYFLSVILTAVFGGICEELLPEKSATRSHLRLVTGICVLAVLVLPLKDLLVGAGEFFGTLDLSGAVEEQQSTEDYEALFEDAMRRYSEEDIGQYLGEILSERFLLKDGTCRVTVALSETGELSRVLVCLSGSSILCDPYEIEGYVNETYACPCDVAVE